tara:strand:- start:44098 stop:44649 length:552 start_codon:yes stop_codon:yes gene_type:complete
MARDNFLTGRERMFDEDQVIVTKTNLKGHITYANDVFQSISALTEAECLGKPHSLIRHPHMPRCIFKLLWETIQSGRELFAYVVNRATNGDHYWVYAHITPSFNTSGEIIGYHSNRRQPDRAILTSEIIPLYDSLREEEARHENPKQAIAASTAKLDAMLDERGVAYDEFICTLGNSPQHTHR